MPYTGRHIIPGRGNTSGSRTGNVRVRRPSFSVEGKSRWALLFIYLCRDIRLRPGLPRVPKMSRRWVGRPKATFVLARLARLARGVSLFLKCCSARLDARRMEDIRATPIPVCPAFRFFDSWLSGTSGRYFGSECSGGNPAPGRVQMRLLTCLSKASFSSLGPSTIPMPVGLCHTPLRSRCASPVSVEDSASPNTAVLPDFAAELQPAEERGVCARLSLTVFSAAVHVRTHTALLWHAQSSLLNIASIHHT